MKKFGIMVIALALLVVGMAMAEPGVPQVQEIQGLGIQTTVIAAGNFDQESSVAIVITGAGQCITGVPPLTCGTYYSSVYTEDTQNSEVGYISYDKDLDVTTANRLAGQYNVQAVKQITYLGVDASSVITNDYMNINSAGNNYGNRADVSICPFGGANKAPSFCNFVETGSNMNLKVANLNTQMGERFIMKSSDPGVAIFNNVGVSAYASDLPSKGGVSAFIKGSVKEGGRNTATANALYETMSFADTTGVSGDISTFAKSMSYSSVFA
jgi:hypothetical protein